MASGTNSTVRRLGVVALDRPEPEANPTILPETPKPEVPPEFLIPPLPAPVRVRTEATNDRMIDIFRALGFALSARMIFLLSVIGAFVMGIVAMVGGGWLRLLLLAVYCALTVLPCAYLEVRKRGPGDA